MIINIPLTTKPGIPNVNGITYSQEEYYKMINSKHYQFLKNNHMLYITNGAELLRGKIDIDFKESPFVSIHDIIGIVIELKDDYTADIEIFDPRNTEIIKDHIDDMSLSMNYWGNLEMSTVSDMSILHYYIQYGGKKFGESSGLK